MAVRVGGGGDPPTVLVRIVATVEISMEGPQISKFVHHLAVSLLGVYRRNLSHATIQIPAHSCPLVTRAK